MSARFSDYDLEYHAGMDVDPMILLINIFSIIRDYLCDEYLLLLE
jgi:hypothetical protein